MPDQWKAFERQAVAIFRGRRHWNARPPRLREATAVGQCKPCVGSAWSSSARSRRRWSEAQRSKAGVVVVKVRRGGARQPRRRVYPGPGALHGDAWTSLQRAVEPMNITAHVRALYA
jgi:hypothetical protein